MADSSSSHRSVSPAPITSVEAGSTSPTLSRMTPPASTASSKQQKQRTGSTSDTNGGSKITKRRAARACVSCRARKVRCDVVEGAPCGNCRWDNVECVVQESRLLFSRQDALHSRDQGGVQLRHFPYLEILPVSRLTRLVLSLVHLFPRYPMTYPSRKVTSLTWRHPCPCFTGRICTQRH
ncbi:hypothetical protein CONLIGDRAFT_631966 [Coniochaeta ligniaria NRRL 30616]|uniref:Zn(2)-C6 fungal-type domain-containing protein n=1 Tax=Coniochaeta ligniaria NRRL 30616 TaxID=1408157 RepID=A0A1J7JQ72_9PEZI|nr:hypothetical protein CONLIGDRAFT_631966 [Coniochaeta ligniaria NRRL 30616]